MGLGEAHDERVFGRIVRLEGLAEAAEDFLVFMLVFLGEDYERCEVRPCFKVFRRLRCLPASVLGPPFRPLRRLASRCRSDAICVSFQ